jgi:hypothetical protein
VPTLVSALELNFKRVVSWERHRFHWYLKAGGELAIDDDTALSLGCQVKILAFDCLLAEREPHQNSVRTGITVSCQFPEDAAEPEL